LLQNFINIGQYQLIYLWLNKIPSLVTRVLWYR